MGQKLYVGNFPYSISDSDLEEMFKSFGTVASAKVIMDRETGRPKGFGFVTFATQAAAEAALELDGRDLGGRPLKVNVAMERDNRGGGGGRPGGGRPGGGGRW